MVDFTKILEQTTKWPQSGGRLFNKTDASRENSRVQKNRHDRHVMMALGYKRGADIMVAELASHPLNKDSLVYPIIFCYRHFIELSLKYLIATYGENVCENKEQVSHDLKKVWAKFRSILVYSGIEFINETDVAVEALVDEFSNMDKESSSFRYATKKNGETIPLDRDCFDLNALKNSMDRLSNYFDGCDGFLSDRSDTTIAR